MSWHVLKLDLKYFDKHLFLSIASKNLAKNWAYDPLFFFFSFGASSWGILAKLINRTAEDLTRKLPQITFLREKQNGNHE